MFTPTTTHLELFDELQISCGNFVVVVFDLGKGFLVVLHQVVNVQVLPFFHLVDLHLALQLQCVGQLGQLLCITTFELFKVAFELVP